MQELQAEIRRLVTGEVALSVGTLCLAINMLNNRVRHEGLSVAQIHFSRDTIVGQNLVLDDKMKEAKAVKKKKRNGKKPQETS